ncbi:8-amino-7-oxononanoate synthase, partial [Enterococcus hirae]
GHQAALPILVQEGDLVLVDVKAHASLQVAARLLRGRGATVRTVGHSDPGRIERSRERSKARKVWLLIDGIYSMIGDIAPFRELDRLLAD